MDKPGEHKVYAFDDFRLDAASLMLYRDGSALSLPPKAIETLLVLVERQGDIITKDELLAAIWPDTVVEESNLALYLHILRKTLGDQEDGKPYLETFRRRGYRFNGSAHVVRDEDGDPQKSEVGEKGVAVGTDNETLLVRRDKRGYLLAGLFVLVLTVAGFSAAYYWRSGQAAPADSGTEDFEAWDNYTKGRFHLGGRLTRRSLQTSIEFFQKAIIRDPNYSSAHAGVARAFITLSPCCDYDPTDAFPKARDAALKAIETDNKSAEAHSVMAGILFWYDWKWAEAEDHCRRAISLDPNSADAHYTYAHLLSNTGRHSEALVEIERALEIEPGNLRNRALEALFIKQAGQMDEAKDKLLKFAQVNPNFWLGHFHLSSIYAEKGMYAEAIAEAEEAKKFSESNYPLALKGYALARWGKVDEARAVLGELDDLRATTTYVPYYYSALINNGLGESEKAIAFLERAFQQHDSMMVFLKVEPKWDNLRSDPRFVELLEKMDLD